MFNTLSYARKLESVGVTRDQAEAHVQIIAEIVEGELATKQDVNELKQGMKEVKNDLDHKIEGMENRLLIKLGALTAGLITIAVTIIAILIQSH